MDDDGDLKLGEPAAGEKKKEPKTKHWQCALCKKKYVMWNEWMNNHILKTGHRKFKKINEGDGFKWKM